MPQHIQLQQVFLHGMIFKMRGDLIRVGIVRGMLHRAKVPDLVFLRDNHQTARMLSGGAPDTHAPCREPGFLRPVGGFGAFGQVFFHITEGGFFRHRTDGSRPENVGFPKHLNAVRMGLCLIFSGEVQIDIRHLVAAEAQEGFKGNVEAILFHLAAAFRTYRVGKIRPAVVPLRNLQHRMLARRIRAAVVGREGIHLGDAGHVCHNGGTHGAPGANQIAVLQGILNQLLGGHINHIIVAGDDVMKLGFHTLGKQLRRVVPIQSVEFTVHQRFQILHGVLNLRSKQVVGNRPQGLAHIRDFVGIGHHHFPGLFLPQIREFPKHFIRGAEIQRVILVRIVKALGGKQNVPENLILRIQEMHISGGHHRFPQILAQPNHRAVKAAKLLFIRRDPLCQHKAVVCQRLNFQEIIEGRNPLQFILALTLHNGLEQLSRLAGGTDQQSLPKLHQLRLGNSGNTLKVFQVRVGNQMIQIAQAHLILGKENDMPCVPVRNAPLGAQVHHRRVDVLKGMNIMLLLQFFHQPVHNQPAGHGVVRRPMVVELRQAQGVGYNIQLKFVQLGQKVLR